MTDLDVDDPWSRLPALDGLVHPPSASPLPPTRAPKLNLDTSMRSKATSTLLHRFSRLALPRFRAARSARSPLALLDPLFASDGETPLVGLQTYAQRLKAAGPAERNRAGLALLLKGYLYGFSRAAAEAGERKDMRSVRRDCLEGVFVARSLLHPPPEDDLDAAAILDEVDLNLRGAHFPPTPDSRCSLLQYVFQYPRSLLGPPQAGRKVRAAERSNGDGWKEAVDAALELLKVFVDGVSTIEGRRGRGGLDTGLQRGAMEARLVVVDLQLSRAAAGIGPAKTRALERFVAGEDGGGASVKGDEGADEVLWEDIAEDSLVHCLRVAEGLIEAGRGAVLVGKATREDWPGEGMGMGTLSCRDSDDAPSDSDSTDDDDEDEDEEAQSHPCPLRTLFRLVDRFEELRLAIWLCLPPATRGGMGRFMRGERGRVGSAWDELGLRLMAEYDRYVIRLLVRQAGPR